MVQCRSALYPMQSIYLSLFNCIAENSAVCQSDCHSLVPQICMQLTTDSKTLECNDDDDDAFL